MAVVAMQTKNLLLAAVASFYETRSVISTWYSDQPDPLFSDDDGEAVRSAPPVSSCDPLGRQYLRAGKSFEGIVNMQPSTNH